MSLTFDKYLSDEGACNALIASAIAVVAGVILYFVAVWIKSRAAGNGAEARGFEVIINTSGTPDSK